MRDEHAFQQALWTWFIGRADTPAQWGPRSAPTEFKDHLLSCGIDLEKSGDLDTTTVSEYGDTLNPNRQVEAIEPSHWVCNCGEYSSRKTMLYISGSVSLSDLIGEVARIASRNHRDWKKGPTS